jgi:hypothetical protein
VPSRKWLVTQITAVGALLTMFATTGSWDVEESVALIGLVTQALASYVLPNAPDKAGVEGQPGQP